MDFYTHVIEDENGSEMKVFAEFGYDMYVDSISMPVEYKELNIILKRFLRTYLPEYQKELIKQTEKKISELSKEKGKLEKNITAREQEIKSLTKEIESLLQKVKGNQEMFEIAELNLETSKTKLDRILKLYNN